MTIPPSAQLRAPALLYRRLCNSDGTQALDELIASAPLMLIASTVMALSPEERHRHWVRSALGRLDADEVLAIAGNWWGAGRFPRETAAHPAA